MMRLRSNIITVVEAVETQEVVRLEEARNEALAHFFELNENPIHFPSSSQRWDIPAEVRSVPGKSDIVTPPDRIERLKEYIKSEIDNKGAQGKVARPGFNTRAESTQLTYTNALNFLETGGEHGRDGMERVLRWLFRVQKLREYKYHEDGKNALWGRDNQGYEVMREWMHILSCQVHVHWTMDTLIGKKEGDSFSNHEVSWEGYKEDKVELETLRASLDRSYSSLPVDWNLLAINQPKRS